MRRITERDFSVEDARGMVRLKAAYVLLEAFVMRCCSYTPRRLTLFLVVAAAGCLGGAAALWRPAAPDQHVVVLDAQPPADMLRDEDALWPPAWSELDSGASEIGAPAPVHVYFMYSDSALAVRRAWLRSLFGWMFALVAMALVAAALGRIRAQRRPLPLAARPVRPVPVVMLLSLVLPMLPQLVLMHADAQLLPAVLLLVASAGVGTAGAMLVARRQLAARLRWAVDGPLSSLPDGTLALAEVEAKKLVAPASGRGRTPWYRADLVAQAREESIRVGLEGATVDLRAAREIAAVTFSGPTGEPLTVMGFTQRVPAVVASVDPLSRAPIQPRLAGTTSLPALVFAGTRKQLQRRLRSESALLFGALAVSVAAAVLALS
jgi:hypothetical protein